MKSKTGKIYIVAGLHYGDQGKGTTVDYLARDKQAALVVRYGGGPQAAHHVVLQNTKWHCFSHFGSGMFVEKCKTVISKYMLIYPQRLQRQTQVLVQKGVKNIYKRLKIDLECFIITPYHQLISRILQILREKKRGSTGIGVGIAVQQAYGLCNKHFPKQQLYPKCQWTCLKLADLFDDKICQQKLKKIYEQKTGLISRLLKMKNQQLIEAIYSKQQLKVHKINIQISTQQKKMVLQQLINFTGKQSFNSFSNCLAFYKKFRVDYQKCFVKTTNIIKQTLQAGKNIIFQGSQGSLLDPIYGIYPHITKTLCTDTNAIQIINQLQINVQYVKIGVLRCYSHRHGAGPFISQDQQWGKQLPQIHNRFSNWQGNFKVGPFDLVIAKYGAEIFKPDYICITCVDRLFEIQQYNKICTKYRIKDFDQELLSLVKQYCIYEQIEDYLMIKQLKIGKEKQLFRSNILLKILLKCQPVYEKFTVQNKKDLIQNLINQIPKKLQKHKSQINQFLCLIQNHLKIPIAIISASGSASGKFKIIPI